MKKSCSSLRSALVSIALLGLLSACSGAAVPTELASVTFAPGNAVTTGDLVDSFASLSTTPGYAKGFKELGQQTWQSYAKLAAKDAMNAYKIDGMVIPAADASETDIELAITKAHAGEKSLGDTLRGVGWTSIEKISKADIADAVHILVGAKDRKSALVLGDQLKITKLFVASFALAHAKKAPAPAAIKGSSAALWDWWPWNWFDGCDYGVTCRGRQSYNYACDGYCYDDDRSYRNRDYRNSDRRNGGDSDRGGYGGSSNGHGGTGWHQDKNGNWQSSSGASWNRGDDGWSYSD